MAKAPKRAFVCNECGADYPRWQGQCSACQAWNTITEVRLAASPTVARNERLSGYAGNAGVAKVQKLSDISLEELPRFSTGFKEFDRVLGGGVVPGSAILIGGNPGAGKSTLLLQTLCRLAEQMKTLYVTGEESLQQVAMRAHRLGLPTANLNMLSETSIEQICLIAEEEQPKLMVIDSIQVMHMADIQSSPGSVAQVRETAAYLTRQGLPATLDDLASHALIGFDSATPLVRRALQAYPRFQREAFAMRTDSDLAQLSLIRAGAGIGICQAPLADGIIPLQRVLAADFSLYLDTWLVMHEDLRHSPACKRVFDFLAQGLQAYIRGPLAS